jgi:hypothetical protein
MKWHPPSRKEQCECQPPAEADKYILSDFRLKNKEDDRMSQIEKLYEAYCVEQSRAPVSQETLRLHEVLSEMLPHKEYLEVEALINASRDNSDKEFFFAGFRAATRLWAVAMK